MSGMRNPQRGVLCAGCPHRAAYIAIKEATRRVRGRVVCGNIGCVAVGAVQPAAATCPGGEEALLPRYRQEVPCDGTPDAPAAPLCVHVAPDAEIAADDAAKRFAGLAAEGATTILAVMASSKAYLSREAIEGLGQRMLELGADSVAVLDPFDLERCGEVLAALIAEPGVHGVLFASPCAQLLRTAESEPVEVDRFMCVGCQRCVQVTGCPALSFVPPVCTVDADACAGCDLCCGVCRTQIIYSPRARMSVAERANARYAAARG